MHSLCFISIPHTGYQHVNEITNEPVFLHRVNNWVYDETIL